LKNSEVIGVGWSPQQVRRRRDPSEPTELADKVRLIAETCVSGEIAPRAWPMRLGWAAQEVDDWIAEQLLDLSFWIKGLHERADPTVPRPVLRR
jgi:hypothetical protein